MPVAHAQILILLVAALALFLGIWRVVHAEIRSLRDDLGARIDRINDRSDRHLEGHP